jgi:hypothetical protein
MSLPRLDHNGTFSLFDLGQLRDRFDTWGEGDTGDCASQMSGCSGNGMAVSKNPVTVQRLLLPFNSHSAGWTRPSKQMSSL